MTAKRKQKTRTSPKSGKTIMVENTSVEVALDLLIPALVNDRIYRPVSMTDPTIVDLGRDIKAKGLLDPIVVTLDHVIVSGHRRRAACLVAGLSVVPIRYVNLHSSDPRFESYLISLNDRRVKATAEKIREEVIRIRARLNISEPTLKRLMQKDDFPRPAFQLTERGARWLWCDVAAWVERRRLTASADDD